MKYQINTTNYVIKSIIVSLLLLFSAQCFAVIFIDVDTFDAAKSFNNPTHKGKGIRVCIFDTSLNTKSPKLPPRYESINYYAHPEKSTTEDIYKHSIPRKDLYTDIVVTCGGNITIPTKFTTNPSQGNDSYIIRTNVIGGKIIHGAKEITENIFKRGPNNQEYPHSITSSSTIIEQLNNCHKRNYGTDFIVNLHHNKDYDQLSFDKLSNPEKGQIGELAMEYVMISYGYNNKFDSQNGSGQGIDGIFSDNSKNSELFLTESKCQGSSIKQNSAKAIMEHYLSVPLTISRLDKISPKAAQDEIRALLKKAFKIACRVKVDGYCEFLVEPFDFDKEIAKLRNTMSSSSSSAVDPNSEWKITLPDGTIHAFESEDNYISYIEKFWDSLTENGIKIIREKLEKLALKDDPYATASTIDVLKKESEPLAERK
ncbi:MAG: hypothetical protein ACD_69C00362G0006 [uncultured bacterium]|nr:MAG: hypothetical protein ACD_69C00362G0006 [uncultured bacterium]